MRTGSRVKAKVLRLTSVCEVKKTCSLSIETYLWSGNNASPVLHKLNRVWLTRSSLNIDNLKKIINYQSVNKTIHKLIVAKKEWSDEKASQPSRAKLSSCWKRVSPGNRPNHLSLLGLTSFSCPMSVFSWTEQRGWRGTTPTARIQRSEVGILWLNFLPIRSTKLQQCHQTLKANDLWKTGQVEGTANSIPKLGPSGMATHDPRAIGEEF